MTLLPALGLFLVAEEGGGFNPLDLTQASNLLWTIVIFLAALPLMWKIVWGPMAKALEERDRHADDAVKAAEAAKAAAEQAKADVEKRLADAQKESAKVIADARAIGEQQGKQALVDAQSQAKQTVEQAKAEIERAKTKALSEIRETVVDLTVDAASKVVGRAINDDDQKRFVRDLVAGAKP